MEDEERKARQREYNRRCYQKHRDERLAYQREYNAAHKEEKREYNQLRYAANRDEILAHQREYAAANREERLAYQRELERQYREWLDAFRVTQGCAVCGRKDVLLDFHHKDPTTKRYNVAGMSGHSLDAIEEELEKCVLLCRSCHRQAHLDLKAGKTPAYEQASEEVE